MIFLPFCSFNMIKIDYNNNFCSCNKNSVDFDINKSTNLLTDKNIKKYKKDE